MEFFCSSNEALQGKMNGKVVVAERHWVFFAEQGSSPPIEFLAQSLANADSIQLRRRLFGKDYLTCAVKVPRKNESGSDIIVWQLYPKGLRCEKLLRELQRKEDGKL
ncbi:hypothetical protein AAVH_19208 [Aphelenchoides avenae]|nr:hypothetical protein AAVH_19208 [Aphelenchus avenae]